MLTYIPKATDRWWEPVLHTQGAFLEASALSAGMSWFTLSAGAANSQNVLRIWENKPNGPLWKMTSLPYILDEPSVDYIYSNY